MNKLNFITEEVDEKIKLSGEQSQTEFCSSVDNKKSDKFFSNDFTIVPREEWDNVSTQTYLRCDCHCQSQFNGFLKSKQYSGTEKFFQLETIVGGSIGQNGYSSFPVPFEEIKILYQQMDSNSIEYSILKKDIMSSNNFISEIRRELSRLEIKLSEHDRKIKSLEKENSELRMWLRRLHSH